MIDVQGDTVLVAESLDEVTTKQVEGEVFAKAVADRN